MKSRQIVFEIHRLKNEGYSTRRIAGLLGIGRNTVVRYLKNPERSGGSRKKRGSKLDPFQPFIDECLQKDLHMNAMVILRKIKERGYTGQITILRDYLKQKRGRTRFKKAFIRYESPPGDQCQVDWAHLDAITYGDTRRRLYALVVVESYSRMLYVEFTHSQKQDVLHGCLLKDRGINTIHHDFNNATESNLKKVVSPEILHLSTHGFFDDEPPSYSRFESKTPHKKPLGVESFINKTYSGDFAKEELALYRSGLAFVNANLAKRRHSQDNDGILYAAEVIELNLAGVKLVVLSGCETGIGYVRRGEGIFGLRRAFQEAGVQSIMSTLWYVADEPAQELMKMFYSLLLSGNSPQKALRKAQLAFINMDNGWDRPYFWAPFVMVGRE